VVDVSVRGCSDEELDEPGTSRLLVVGTSAVVEVRVFGISVEVVVVDWRALEVVEDNVLGISLEVVVVVVA
jgi:hypothetical protein